LKIFLSYRREDSAGQAGRLADRLKLEFGDILFMDVDGIPLGVNFVERLSEEIATCNVLLAVIGHEWLNIRDQSGARRLDNPTDFVRVEIATALRRSIPLIPILLDGTKLPQRDQLPEDLRELTIRNGLDLRHASFHVDVGRLIHELQQTLVIERPQQISRGGSFVKPIGWLGGITLLAGGVGAAVRKFAPLVHDMLLWIAFWLVGSGVGYLMTQIAYSFPYSLTPTWLVHFLFSIVGPSVAAAEWVMVWAILFAILFRWLRRLTWISLAPFLGFFGMIGSPAMNDMLSQLGPTSNLGSNFAYFMTSDAIMTAFLIAILNFPHSDRNSKI
jgi:hypothetical protein